MFYKLLNKKKYSKKRETTQVCINNNFQNCKTSY